MELERGKEKSSERSTCVQFKTEKGVVPGTTEPVSQGLWTLG